MTNKEEPGARPEKFSMGRIQSAKFGLGGYQGAQFGLWVTLNGPGWGVGVGFNGGWAFEPDDRTKWTSDDQNDAFAAMCRKTIALLKSAGVSSVHELVDIPVWVRDDLIGREVKEGDWGVLEDVLRPKR